MQHLRNFALAALLCFAVMALVYVSVAHAHSWYTGMKSVGTDYPCCGGNDCHPLEDGDVAVVPNGYYIKSLQLFVPNWKAQPGADQRYHVCIVPSTVAIDNAPRCFFFPGPGM